MQARRTIALMAAVTATGALAAGCGSGGGSSTGSGSGSSAAGAPAAGSAPIAGTSIAKARAVAYAHAVNLGAADVPASSVVKPEGEAKAPTAAGVEFARCTGGVNPERRIADIHSPTFRITGTYERERVRSGVEVMPTAALAAQSNTATRSVRGRACLARLLARTSAERGVEALPHGPISVSSLPNQLPGADGSFGLRIATTAIGRSLQGAQTRTHVYTDLFGFVSGAAEINLTATGIARPVPSATEQRLLSLLFSRAQAHKL
jgi:hypothetical protein